jgi:hypothetical protein
MNQRLSILKNRHLGERCVLVANGPSLNEMNLSFLRHETTIGLNKIFLGFKKFNFYPRYYVAINPVVIQQSAAQIKTLNAVKFLSTVAAKDYLNEDALTYFVQAHGFHLDKDGTARTKFSVDIAKDGFYEGWTVTFAALQVAYFLGFSEVVLIGLDHRFAFKGGPNQRQILDGKDMNHFDRNYFGGGQEWDTPDLVNSEAAYKVARDFYEANGRKIFDATLGGACEVFEKIDYHSLFLMSSDR